MYVRTYVRMYVIMDVQYVHVDMVWLVWTCTCGHGVCKCGHGVCKCGHGVAGVDMYVNVDMVWLVWEYVSVFLVH